ncbi:type III-A CRISPR-associated protein Cas10/Csm1 [Fervidibacillus albus]|uniref:CRISPR system single-strand-specific deoxyribonuclease Cas10/Csm1 (subtype III-A) n=1 Tax=Fervidibacillus albus TaxID=2980026 RepID=A0A9E8RVT7_9BACI|nr:type III-A CRISPR-associated protein Cas10/Csm1 [Fervidibacillus albus]WAA09841.1 type III-A CRISPR-associated protein Cas10/Csm1 [Fervidibacillus albus]
MIDPRSVAKVDVHFIKGGGRKQKMEPLSIKNFIQTASFFYYLQPYFLQKKIIHASDSTSLLEQTFQYLRQKNSIFEQYESIFQQERSVPFEKIIYTASELNTTAGGKVSEFKINKEIQYKPLQSVFSSLFGQEHRSLFYPLKPLSFENIFPVQKVEQRVDVLMEQFLNELKTLTSDQQIISLMEKYFCSVSSFQSREISLYDEMKTTAAISISFYDQIKNGDLTETDLNRFQHTDKPSFILIQGDVSGIQSFIFNIPSKGAAKSLKGRSVYVSLLSEVIARYILRELSLPFSNLLYNGGGNFFILAPYESKTQFEQARLRVLKTLMKVHKGEIYFALESVVLKPTDFHHFADKWQEVINKTNQLKKRKWSELGLESSYERIFGPLDQGSHEENVCKVCGSFASRYSVIPSEDEEDKYICTLCHSFVELTNELKNANYIVFQSNWSSDKKKVYQEIFHDLGYHISFHQKKRATLQSNENEEFWYKLNDTNFLADQCTGFHFGAYQLPTSKGNVATFEDLSKRSIEIKNEEQIGDPKIAHIKLDVDNLGSLFGMGIGKERSIAKISALSRMLHLYFGGYINYLIQEKRWTNELYVVFSGGDDTYIVGSWPKVFDFAKEFYSKFQEFTGYNPFVTFSAGINVFHYTYPIIRAAEITESSLDHAKSGESKETQSDHLPPSKNKISFLGEVFNWDEYEKVKSIKEILYKMVQRYGRNVLFKVEKSTHGFKNILHDSLEGRFRHVKFWRLAYYLREIKEDYRKAEKKGFPEHMLQEDLADQLIEQYRNIVIHNLFKPRNKDKIYQIMIIPAAVKWAELATRKVKKEDYDE